MIIVDTDCAILARKLGWMLALHKNFDRVPFCRKGHVVYKVRYFSPKASRGDDESERHQCVDLLYMYEYIVAQSLNKLILYQQL